MQQLDISLNKGIRRSPSFAQTGELAECVNIYPKNGELRNIPAAVAVKDGLGADLTLGTNAGALIGVHNTDSLTIYISRGRKNVGLVDESDALYATIIKDGEAASEQVIAGPEPSEDIRIATIGRIMITYGSDGIYYYRWKGDTYKALGRSIPNLHISFGLQGKVTGTRGYVIDTTEIFPDGTTGELNSTKELKDAISGMLSKLDTDAANDGYFTHDFFVRYALRMYDGQTHTNVSHPVLMTVCTSPIIFGKPGSGSFDFYAAEIAAKLDYYVHEDNKELFEDWEDIIQGVDIFVSAPIVPYSINDLKLAKPDHITTAYYTDSALNNLRTEPTVGFTISKTEMTGDTYAFDGYERKDMALCFAQYMRDAHDPYVVTKLTTMAVRLQVTDDDETTEELYKGEGPYYLLKSLNWNEIKVNERTLLPVARDAVKNLVTRSVLKITESFKDVAQVSDVFVYNQRINAYGIKKEISCEYPLSSMLPYTNKYHTYEWFDGRPDDQNISPSAPSYHYNLAIELQGAGDEQETIRVADTAISVQGDELCLEHNMIHFLYADTTARKAVIYRPDGNDYTGFNLELTPYTGLISCSYIHDNASWQEGSVDVADITPTTDNYKSYPNRIYQSLVDNPFAFSPANNYDVGSGRIMRLAANTEPLSTGQFGQFPIVAFATDGIWALDILDDGTLRPAKPVSRDILSVESSVMGVDGGIIFITNQGLKYFTGDKQIKLLTDALEGPNVDESVYFPTGATIRSYITAWLPLLGSDTTEVRSMLQHCKLAYDGKDRNVHIWPQSGNKQYVLSLDSLEFASQITENSTPQAVVESYPFSVMQFSGDRHLYIYDGEPVTSRKYGWCLSRVFSCGELEQYTTIMQMKMYDDIDRRTVGQIAGGDLKTAIFVSNDKRTWALLPSLKSGSFKYYRFALFTKMNDYEAVSGLSMLYNPSRLNKLR